MPQWFGAVAQLGERVVRNDEVSGSIPLGSTISRDLITHRFAGPAGDVPLAGHVVSGRVAHARPQAANLVSLRSHPQAVLADSLRHGSGQTRQILNQFPEFMLTRGLLGRAHNIAECTGRAEHVPGLADDHDGDVAQARRILESAQQPHSIALRHAHIEQDTDRELGRVIDLTTSQQIQRRFARSRDLQSNGV